MATRSDVLRLTITVEGKQAEAAMKRFAGGAEKANKKVSASATAMVKKFGLVAAAVGGTVFAIDRLVRKAQEVTNLSRAFDTLGGRIDATAGFLPKLREATQGLVSDMDLMKQANTAIILGLPVTEDSMAKLTDQAIRLGAALGVDAKRAIESMITGIGRQSKLMLDNLGIIINLERTYSAYAASVGKTVDELSEADRKLAFFQSTVEAADAAVKGLNASSLTFGDIWTRVSVQAVNSINLLLDHLNRLPGAFERALSGKAGGVDFLDFLRTTPMVDPDAVSPFGLLPFQPSVPEPTLAEQQTQLGGRALGIAPHQPQPPDLSEFEGLLTRLGIRTTEELDKMGQAVGMALQQLNQIEEPTARIEALEQALRDVGASIIDEGGVVPGLTIVKETADEISVAYQDFLNIAQQGAMTISGTFVDAAFGAKVAWEDFFKQFLKDIAKAIIQALILRAITAAFGPAGAVGGSIVSQTIGQAAGTSASSAGGTALPAGGTTTINNTFTGTFTDEQSMTRILENHPEAFGAGFRNATRRGTIS